VTVARRRAAGGDSKFKPRRPGSQVTWLRRTESGGLRVALTRQDPELECQGGLEGPPGRPRRARIRVPPAGLALACHDDDRGSRPGPGRQPTGGPDTDGDLDPPEIVTVSRGRASCQWVSDGKPGAAHGPARDSDSESDPGPAGHDP
jgi:hypothetical protein